MKNQDVDVRVYVCVCECMKNQCAHVYVYVCVCLCMKNQCVRSHKVSQSVCLLESAVAASRCSADCVTYVIF